MSSTAFTRRGIYKSAFVRRIALWVDEIPHPPLAIEISASRIAGVRFTRTGGLDGFAVEELPAGAIAPSAVETNIANPGAVQKVMESVVSRLQGQDLDATLLLPDPVIRVFVQHFDQFPRSPEDAIPMLRWKLKKSVPFEAEETLISYMRQPPRENGVDVVTGLARLRIVREYEALAETFGLRPGVVMSSSLAAVELLGERRSTLLARISGSSLTTAIVRDGVLCRYRCTELPAEASFLTPQTLLEEIFPLAAYYQDTWQAGVQLVRVSGLGNRLSEFAGPLEEEFHCPVRALSGANATDAYGGEEIRPLAERELDGLIGWIAHRG